MTKENCVSIECIYNDRLKKGLCIGVSKDTRTYAKDVIRLCWVKDKHIQGKPCSINMQVQMTPAEATGIGVGLIRSSLAGESLLRSQPKEGEKKK